tara:strand:- start:159 stop:407 length:249 start_codon:yes stop_codon:yes gene_type:complete
MKKTNETFQYLVDNGFININDFYCITVWERELKLQGNYSSGLVKSFDSLDLGFDEITRSVDNLGYVTIEFMKNDTPVHITLT